MTQFSEYTMSWIEKPHCLLIKTWADVPSLNEIYETVPKGQVPYSVTLQDKDTINVFCSDAFYVSNEAQVKETFGDDYRTVCVLWADLNKEPLHRKPTGFFKWLKNLFTKKENKNGNNPS